MDNFTRRIKTLRLSKGFFQDDIAKKLNVSRTVYTQIENGKRKVTADEVVMLAEIFGVTTDVLLNDDHAENPRNLDDKTVFNNIVSGYFEVNVTQNEVVGDITAINDIGEHVIIAPVKKECGRLYYDVFEQWWEANMLAEETGAFSSQFNSNALITSFYKGQKITERKYLSKSTDDQHRTIKYTCYLSQLKTGDIYGIIVFFDVSTSSLTQEDSRQLSELTAALSESFESLYYVDLRNDSYIVINNQGEFSKLFLRLSGKNFFAESVKNLRTVAYKDDYKKISSFISKDNLLSEFAQGPNTVISNPYRLLVDGVPLYYRIRASIRKSDPDHLLIAVENINDFITKDMLYQARLKRDRDIIEVLSAEYSSIYCVNLAENSFELCKTDKEIASFLDIETMKKTSFSEVYRLCVEHMVYEPDRTKMLEAGSIYNILLRLKEKSSFSTIYRSSVSGKLQYCEMKTVKIGTSDFPTEVVIGFADRSQEKASEIERELNIQKILSLSRNLEAVIEIDLLSGAYYYRTAVDLADVPNTPAVIHEGYLHDEEIRETTLSQLYPDDQDLIRPFLTTEGLSKAFLERSSFEIKFRCLTGGSVRWKSIKGVLNTQNNEPVAIIGIFNIDEEQKLKQKRLAEIRQLTHDATFDNLTGIRNRNAYASKEAEINRKILFGELKEYAVVVFDLNSLKNANDIQGHARGDELLKISARIICDTFKHSPVFRIGGDEFIAFLTGSDFHNRGKLVDLIYERSKAAGNGSPILAVGMADRIETDRTLSDTFKRADKAMYENKKASKNKR